MGGNLNQIVGLIEVGEHQRFVHFRELRKMRVGTRPLGEVCVVVGVRFLARPLIG